jgi:hypothetical protein
MDDEWKKLQRELKILRAKRDAGGYFHPRDQARLKWLEERLGDAEEIMRHQISEPVDEGPKVTTADDHFAVEVSKNLLDKASEQPLVQPFEKEVIGRQQKVVEVKDPRKRAGATFRQQGLSQFAVELTEDLKGGEAGIEEVPQEAEEAAQKLDYHKVVYAQDESERLAKKPAGKNPFAVDFADPLLRGLEKAAQAESLVPDLSAKAIEVEVDDEQLEQKPQHYEDLDKEAADFLKALGGKKIAAGKDLSLGARTTHQAGDEEDLVLDESLLKQAIDYAEKKGLVEEKKVWATDEEGREIEVSNEGQDDLKKVLQTSGPKPPPARARWSDEKPTRPMAQAEENASLIFAAVAEQYKKIPSPGKNEPAPPAASDLGVLIPEPPQAAQTGVLIPEPPQNSDSAVLIPEPPLPASDEVLIPEPPEEAMPTQTAFPAGEPPRALFEKKSPPVGPPRDGVTPPPGPVIVPPAPEETVLTEKNHPPEIDIPDLSEDLVELQTETSAPVVAQESRPAEDFWGVDNEPQTAPPPPSPPPERPAVSRPPPISASLPPLSRAGVTRKQPVTETPPAQAKKPQTLFSLFDDTTDDAPAPLADSASVFSPLTKKQPRPTGRPNDLRGERKVTVHYRDGVSRRGKAAQIDPGADALELELGGKKEKIRAEALKAVFVILPPGTAYPEKKGRAVRLVMMDGRSLEGFTPDYQPTGRAFTLFPARDEGNIERVIVYNDAVKNIWFDK